MGSPPMDESGPGRFPTAKDDPAYVTHHVFVLADSSTADGTTYYEFSNPHGPDKPPLVLTPEEFDEYFSGAGTY